jgi:DNA-binding response OmpR family regulator
MFAHGIIAVIEDPFIRKLLRDILTRHGYQVVEYTTPHVAELLRSGAEQIDLIITNTPGDFLEFAEQLPVVYLAAAPDPELAACFQRCTCIRKPFMAEDLVAAITELIEAK